MLNFEITIFVVSKLNIIDIGTLLYRVKFSFEYLYQLTNIYQLTPVYGDLTDFPPAHYEEHIDASTHGLHLFGTSTTFQ